MELVPCVELVTAVVNILGVFCCIYLAKVLDEDPTWIGYMQRGVLLLLALAFTGNAFIEFRIGEHKLTGMFVALTAGIFIVTMAVRAHRDATRNKARRLS